MSEYVAPLRDMQFVLHEIAPLERLAHTARLRRSHASILPGAILEEAGKFAARRAVADERRRRPRRRALAGRRRSTAGGWREAYTQFAEGGWNALSCDPEHGGQGLPRLVSALVEEMWNARQHVVRAVPDADARRDRGAGAARLRRAEATPTCRRW